MFASFFGAFMVASAYGYFHYKFSSFKFLNFQNIILYTSQDLFVPTQERYALIFYSSKQNKLEDLIKKIKTEEYPVLAIDFAQKVRVDGKNYQGVTGGFNQLLKIVNRLHLEYLPSVMIIKREKKLNYKQDSSLEML